MVRRGQGRERNTIAIEDMYEKEKETVKKRSKSKIKIKKRRYNGPKV